MPLFRETILLFLLNFLDAVLTIVWVRNGIAGEANDLMAYLLDIGDAPFLGAKLAIGTLAAVVLLRFGHRPLAKYGVAAALVVYIGVMAIHVMTYLMHMGVMTTSHLMEIPGAAYIFAG